MAEYHPNIKINSIFVYRRGCLLYISLRKNC
nr:MAG TPA: hypothetical protein [Bacteriophage sp.]